MAGCPPSAPRNEVWLLIRLPGRDRSLVADNVLRQLLGITVALGEGTESRWGPAGEAGGRRPWHVALLSARRCRPLGPLPGHSVETSALLGTPVPM